MIASPSITRTLSWLKHRVFHPKPLLRDHLHDLHVRGDLVSKKDGRLEIERLRQVEAPRPGEFHPDRGRDRPRRKEAVSDPLPEARLLRKLLRDMNGIAVTVIPANRKTSSSEKTFVNSAQSPTLNIRRSQMRFRSLAQQTMFCNRGARIISGSIAGLKHSSN